MVRKIEVWGQSIDRSAALGYRQRQHPRRPTEAHRWASDHAPAFGANYHGPPMLIGEIKIEVAGMLSDSYIDRPLGGIKLRACFEQIERRGDGRSARRGPGLLVIAAP